MQAQENSYFADLIRRTLKEKNISLRALCKQAGVDASYMSKVLLGKRCEPGDEETLERIAKALGLRNEKVFLAAGRVPLQWRRLCLDDEFFDAIAARLTQVKPQQPANKPQGQPQIKIPDELL